MGEKRILRFNEKNLIQNFIKKKKKSEDLRITKYYEIYVNIFMLH